MSTQGAQNQPKEKGKLGQMASKKKKKPRLSKGKNKGWR